MPRGRRASIRIALLASCLAAVLTVAPRAGAVSLQPVGTFASPIYMTSPPGDPRLFVVQRPGGIFVVDNGVITRFLRISDLTTTDSERGLLSMAFDPDYANNGLFYVFYTGDGTDSGGTLGDGHVDEFHVSSNPDVADPTSRRPVLTIGRPGSGGTHNGGQLQFGADGYLYISVGDGGTGGSTAPDLTVLNGKVLRIDPHGDTPGAYGIPPDNPYASSDLDRHEIWASGFRNPWRFSFDHITGDMAIGDVGQLTWEEVDFVPAATGLGRGENFGWPSCEGFYDQGTSTPCTSEGMTGPVSAYPHSDPGGDAAFGCAVMGGYVYRGNQIPDLYGRYLYADHCAGEIRSLQLSIPRARGDRAETAAGALDQPDAFGEDSSCNLYVTNGSVVEKIVGSPDAAVEPACQQPPAAPGNPGVSEPVIPSPIAKRTCKRRRHHASVANKHKKKRCRKPKQKK